jgi:hypothetical protein
MPSEKDSTPSGLEEGDWCLFLSLGLTPRVTIIEALQASWWVFRRRRVGNLVLRKMDEA